MENESTDHKSNRKDKAGLVVAGVLAGAVVTSAGCLAYTKLAANNNPGGTPPAQQTQNGMPGGMNGQGGPQGGQQGGPSGNQQGAARLIKIMVKTIMPKVKVTLVVKVALRKINKVIQMDQIITKAALPETMVLHQTFKMVAGTAVHLIKVVDVKPLALIPS